MDKKLLLLGSLPPPIGGVTIHTKRLLLELQREGLTYSFLDIRPQNKRKYWTVFLEILNSKEKTVHYQLNNWREAAVLAFLFRIQKKKFISTIHSFPTDYDHLHLLSKIMIRAADCGVSCFVAPSETIKKQLVRAKIKEEKIRVIHTFLPPSEEEVNEKIDDEIMDFACKSANEKIVLANGFKLYLNDKGEDVYGLDMCIEACRRLKFTKFIFVCPIIEDTGYFERCLAKIKKYELAGRFFIYRKKVSLVSLMKIADIFVRPTISDSYGISVAEALYLGVPALASDVCERTPGTILFKKGDYRDFQKKLRAIISGRKMCGVEMINYSKELYEFQDPKGRR